LNTDGIDPQGSNVHIRRVKITSYDDAVAVKPSDTRNVISEDKCTQNILVEDSQVVLSVGMTIGTVPSNLWHTCIRNVTFRNIKFDKPFKAVYVKTNPGLGTGEISNILYENIDISMPIWWAIYIGPQQQKQPDGGGPGCMFYPLIPDCTTQAAVSIHNITLRNISSSTGILPPGIIRCNETNPCTGINFENVQMDGWFNNVGIGYIVENAYGSVVNSYPEPDILEAGETREQR
jgi:polygalacturonase